MYLNKLYSQPSGLFDDVHFLNGLNIIYGQKSSMAVSKKNNSLNGIGKSLLLDFICFTLLSPFNKSSLPRLVAAKSKGVLQGYSIVLEFTVDKTKYSISRSFADHSQIVFSAEGEKPVITEIGDFEPILSKLVFGNVQFNSHFRPEWYQKLLKFFVKSQQPGGTRYSDPFWFNKGASRLELIILHLYLLGIDTSILVDMVETAAALKSLRPLLSSITEYLLADENIFSISGISARIAELEAEIQKLNTDLDSFKLNKQYRNRENRANELTRKIKELWYDNAVSRENLKNLEDESIVTPIIRPATVDKLYTELNSLFANKLKSSLNDVADFHKSLQKERGALFGIQINNLKIEILAKEQQIEALESERSQIYNFLSGDQAWQDLRASFENLNRLNEELGRIKGAYLIYQDTKEKIDKHIISLKEALKTLPGLLQNYLPQTDKIQSQTLETFTYFFPDIHANAAFSLTVTQDPENPLQLEILTDNEMNSSGLNYGRIVSYDLAALFLALDANRNIPHFLIHDGFFANMDKSHFINICKYVNEKSSSGIEFQYIVTLNEDGIIDEKFGDADFVSPANLQKYAIRILSSNKKLLKTNF